MGLVKAWFLAGGVEACLHRSRSPSFNGKQTSACGRYSGFSKKQDGSSASGPTLVSSHSILKREPWLEPFQGLLDMAV